MNKKKFLQTASEWGGLGYPKSPCYVRNCGCGMVSIANVIIEMEKYRDSNPKKIQPYCKQYAAPNCDGTYFSGIPKMMEHYGLKDVKECSTMPELWKELEKGNRVALYLMGSRRGGSKKVHWTSGGHFVSSVGFRIRNGLHEVYVKDSYSNSKLRNKWISYEENMRNDVVRVWCGRLPKKKKTVQDKICNWAEEIADSGDYRYKKYTSNVKTHQCPICHKLKGRYKGWNCIGFAFAAWHHGGKIDCRCSCDVMTDQLYNRILHMPLKEAKKIVAERTGLDMDEFTVHRRGGKKIPFSKLKRGDIIVYYTSKGYVHTALYIGNGLIADCTQHRKPQIKYGAKAYTSMTIKFAIRYKGK